MRSLLPLLCLVLAWTKGAGASDPSLPFMVYLDQDHLVCLKWGFDNPQGTIILKVLINTTGWIGFGFSPNGGMAGADIIMGGLGPSGIYFADYYATGNSKPVEDTKQSYTLQSMIESEGQTIMTVQRSIQACDNQDFDITAQPIKLIYAYGTTDEISYHSSRRGTMEVNLLNYMPRTSISNPTYLSASVDNITVPAYHTYYHCKVMNFPSLTTKHHIYQIEPVIENHDIVHHMLLYRCPSFVLQSYDKPCYMGDVGDACFWVVASWAVGGGVFELPENAGIPIGGEDSNIFYRLEVHYNNPNMEAGRIDSSGLRLHYTAQLREHDVGILNTGVLPLSKIEYKIPPNAPQFHTYGICNTTLFSQLVNPVPDLQVFSVLLHTHLAGRKVRVGQFRDGKQIDFLGVNENYDFEVQEIISVGNIRTIKPGDEIVVECTYNTVNRTGVTKMGLATTDEMCLAFLYYYPAIKIASCTSQPNSQFLINSSYPTSSDQAEIAEYQNALNTIPQFQLITDDDDNNTFYTNGIVRELMSTPTVTCNAPSRIMNPAGIVLLLVWIAIM
ncbi:DBH-like monooxygenase protein 2 homolog [Lates japonicus]|uniref:DBH-like monooxygenase protein 2 homolog n=1 Tax=Lates japonicus TaxID=270547 RepID=A0AAD3R9I4_LATJO|nr:DBH-like monooxygenase protein 2 homolog [Lates japonicus]